MISRKHLLLAAGLAMLGCAQVPQAQDKDPKVKPLAFVVVGDAPYDDEQRAMLKQAVSQTKAMGAPFVIHLGDYKGGGQHCATGYDKEFSDLINSLDPIPVLYTPGDNEWVDCDRFDDPATGKKMSELGRLAKIRTAHFFKPPANVHRLEGYIQQDRVRENAAWSYEGVHFATLHITGTNNGRGWVVGDDPKDALSEAETREAAAVRWIARQTQSAAEAKARALVFAMHADPTDVKKKVRGVKCVDARADGEDVCDAFTPIRKALVAAARSFDGPVLLIHGDTHPFTLNQKMNGDTAPNFWRLNAAGDSGIGSTGFRYGVPDVTLVTYIPDNEKPFSAVGLTTGKSAK